MALKVQFARILGALAVLAALSLAPSVASAHAGHAHPQAAAAATDWTVAPVSKAVAEVTATPASSPVPSDAASCAGSGCCSSGPCTGCHGFVLTPVPVPMPPVRSSS